MARLSFNSPAHVFIATEVKKLAKKDLTIIDYGCGEGELLGYLQMNAVSVYKGYEVNTACIPVAKKRWKKYPQAKFVSIDRSKLPSFGRKNSVDAVILIGVVQYMPEKDLRHVLREAKRTLKPGGKLLVSTTTDHAVYAWFNLYRLFLPHQVIRRALLLRRIERYGFTLEQAFERGLFLTPLFANVFVLFFDIFDKLFYKTKGSLGPVGRKAREMWSPVITQEYKLKFDFGHTLFVVASK